MLDTFFNTIFGWAINWSPLGGLFIIAFTLTFIITIIYKLMTDQEALKSIKEEMKQLRQEMKEAKDNPERLMELQKKSMEHSLKQMKMSLKPMLVTFIPLIIVFSWLKVAYSNLPINFIGIHSWLWIYVIFAVVSSIILRKALKVH
jgi:uncharacterized membrane protein (DUF106 family)